MERPAITSGRLAAIWPEAGARLIHLALSRGADRQTAEDIAQEVAVRAIKGDVGFHDLEDFFGWASTVAKNLCVDHARSQGRFVALQEVPDVSGGHDVHGEVEKRMRLSRTLREMARLDVADRVAIIDGVNETPHPNRQTAVRLAVRRHRARARLLQMVEGVAAFWAFVKGGRRLVVAAPATVAVCSILALPAVVRHLQDGNAAPPRAVALTPQSGLPAQAERAERAGSDTSGATSVREVPAPTGGKPASEAPPKEQGTTLVPHPTSGNPLVDDPPADEVPDHCYVFIDDASGETHCVVPQYPTVPNIPSDR